MLELQDLDVHYYLLKFLLSIIILLTIMSPMMVKADYSEVEWLARNIYHEARGEGIYGMIAVSIVTINRVEDSRYPNTIKGVITQPHQFTWYNKKKIKSIKKNNNYHICLMVSKVTIALWKSKKFERFIRQTNISDVKWYHEKSARPRWLYEKDEFVRIGNHILYKDV